MREELIDMIFRLSVFVSVGLICIRLENLIFLNPTDNFIAALIGIFFGAWVLYPLYSHNLKQEDNKNANNK